MGYVTVATNDVLTASHYNTEYRDQVTAQVTSASRPSGVEGQIISESDTDKFLYYDGAWVEFLKRGAWNTWTPTLTATTTSPTLGSGSSQAGRYIKIGRLVIFQFAISFGSSGAAAGSGTYEISLPVNAATTITNAHSGTVRLYDSNVGGTAHPALFVSSATVLRMSYALTWPSGTQTAVGAAAPWTWAASDGLFGQGVYEAAA